MTIFYSIPNSTLQMGLSVRMNLNSLNKVHISSSKGRINGLCDFIISPCNFKSIFNILLSQRTQCFNTNTCFYKSKIAMLSRNPEYVDLSKSDNNTVNSFSVAASLTLVFTFILMFLQNFELSNHYRDNSLLISWRYSTLVTSTNRLKL